ncbi:KdsC family phosphatase [Leucothrix arctica]|uniref:3-deoxy-D-manno-octulosonate 8-phosphate phosphatase KdsC n=1 Tax=Leucothrix arctica TaxID=1481894 RepID=A0A317CHY3_9GAMM|nr:HAD hydrolase family protein [Leucothrix arctica]PWQ95892.1 phenylphosphate carboxylase subunit delta [Leucothrix arctica]
MERIQSIAQNIKLLIMDIDGVLTDGSLFFDNNGDEYKAFSARDGLGMKMLYASGLQAALITGRKSSLVVHRANNLKIPLGLVYQGYMNKRPALDDILKKTGFSPEHVAYIGDDLIDVPIIRAVGLGVAVGDAHDFVKEHADYITVKNGGKGAAREVIELILDAQGKLQPMLDSHLK